MWCLRLSFSWIFASWVPPWQIPYPRSHLQVQGHYHRFKKSSRWALEGDKVITAADNGFLPQLDSFLLGPGIGIISLGKIRPWFEEEGSKIFIFDWSSDIVDALRSSEVVCTLLLDVEGSADNSLFNWCYGNKLSVNCSLGVSLCFCYKIDLPQYI